MHEAWCKETLNAALKDTKVLLKLNGGGVCASALGMGQKSKKS